MLIVTKLKSPNGSRAYRCSFLSTKNNEMFLCYTFYVCISGEIEEIEDWMRKSLCWECYCGYGKLFSCIVKFFNYGQKLFLS